MGDIEGSAIDVAVESPITLLLIEDDAGDALLVEEMIVESAVDFRLTWARSLTEARAQLTDAPPDCIVLDLNLPDAHGLEGLAAVQRLARAIPIVVMTGLAEEHTGLAAVSGGAQDYLVKGHVDTALLTRAARYAIGRKRSEQAAAALRISEQKALENARLERGLLPTPLLRGSRVEVAMRYRTGRAGGLLGGDFFDVVECSDGTVHLLIGDVCGHGADEAALGVGLRVAWRTLVLGGVEAHTAMSTLEELLVSERPRSHVFATATSIAMPTDRHTIEVVRAGHPGFLLRGPAGVEMVEVPAGPALGLRQRPGTWPTSTVPLPTDAAVVLFTDGLFEARVSARDRLGEDRLLGYARSCHEDTTGDVFVDTLIGHAETLSAPYGGLDDDVAVLHVRWPAGDAR